MNQADDSSNTLQSLSPDDSDAAVRLWKLWQQGQAPELQPFLAQVGTLPRKELLEVIRVDQRERWERGERVLAEVYVETIADLQGDPDGLLDLVYDEICLRESRRETPKLDEYLTRFPAHADRLRRQFEVHQAMAGAPDDDTDLSLFDGKGKIAPDSPATWLLNAGTKGPGKSPFPVAAKIPEIPGYEILGEIDRGGMGVVYKARQAGLNRIVALKMILAGAYAGEEQLARFQIEAEAVAQLKHPNIIQIYQVGQHDGQAFFSLEYAEGGSLSRRLSGLPQPPLKAAQTMAILARAVHAAHQCGIVHRDLKPANVLLTADGIPKVTDFGLAKQLGSDTGQTRSGIIMGTPSYMAPEQALGKGGEISAATDIYALGAILYEMLTGRPPFIGENSLDTLQQVLVAEPIHPIQLQPGVPRDLETICLKCLAKEPAKRYPSGLALADDLQRFLDGEPIRARRVPLWERWWKWAKRRPAIAGLTMLVFLVAVAGLVGVLVQWREAVAARFQAQGLQAKAEKQLYALSIVHADSGIAHGDVDQAQLSLLEAPEQLRNWEWRYLQRLCRTSGLTLRGHDRDVTCLAFGDGGRLLATAGVDQTIRVWDARTGTELKGLFGHQYRINTLAFHRDGRRLASADDKGFIRIYAIDTDHEPMEFKAHTGFVSALVFLPDGERLASASEDKTIRIWELKTGRQALELRGHSDSILGLACDPAGKLLASSSKDKTVRLWDLASGQELRQLMGHEERVTSVAFSPDGQLLASCGKDGSVRVWNPADGKLVVVLSSPAAFVSGVAFQAQSNRLAAVCGEPGTGEVKMWDFVQGQSVPGLRIQSRHVVCLAFSPSGDRLATARADGLVQIIEPDLALGSQALQGHNGVVNALAYAPNGAQLASASYDRQLILWDVALERAIRTVEGAGGWVRTTAYSGDGKLLAVAGEAPEILILDPATGERLKTLKGHSGATFAVALNHDGSRLVSVGEDPNVKIWDVAGGQPLRELTGHTAELKCLALAGNGQLIATGADDQTVRLWDLASGRELRVLDVPSGFARSLAFSPDGRMLVAGCGSPTKGEAVLWDLQGKEPPSVLSGHKGFVLGVAFSPDGSRLATASEDRTIKVWDLAERKPLLTLSGHALGVQCVQFSPDGMFIAGGGADGTIRIWNGKPLADDP